jgi:hypothetical protein
MLIAAQGMGMRRWKYLIRRNAIQQSSMAEHLLRIE